MMNFAISTLLCCPEVLFETCVAMKFVEDDDDDLLLRNIFRVLFF